MDQTPQTPKVFSPQPATPASPPEPQISTTTTQSSDIPVATPDPVAAPAPAPDAPTPPPASLPETPAPEPPIPPEAPGTPPPPPNDLNTSPEPQRPKMMRWLAALIAIAILAGGGYGAYAYFNNKAKPAKPHYKIGVMVAFSGGSSSMGYGEIKGISLAKRQLGAENIEIIQEDSKCDPKIAKQAIKKLIDQGVVAIIGDGCSSASTAALPAASQAKVPMISPSASSPSLSIPDDYFFRVIPPDNFQGAFMAKTIYDKGIRTIGIFYTSESYGIGISKVFKEKFEALGGKVVAMTSAEPDVIDLDNQIATIKAANPQAIYFAPNSTLSATSAIKLANETGINVPYFGGDVLYDKTVMTNVGTAAEGIIMTSFPTGSKAFKRALYNEYQATDLLYGGAQAYDAFKAVYLAIERGANTGEKIKNTLPSIEFEGVSEHIKFDKNGEISGPGYMYDLLTVKDGEIVTVTD